MRKNKLLPLLLAVLLTVTFLSVTAPSARADWSGVGWVGNRALYGCENLKSVEFPASGMTRVGDYAFCGCTSLASCPKRSRFFLRICSKAVYAM